MHRPALTDLILHLSSRIAEVEARTSKLTTAITASMMDGVDTGEAEAALRREMDTLAELRLLEQTLRSMQSSAGYTIH